VKYKLIIFDIDGTITRHISSWRYIHEKLGIWSNRAFRYQEDFLAGKISYKTFCELDAAHWRGISEKKIRAIFAKVRYSKNAARAIRRLKDRGFKLVAVSTGLQFMCDRIRREFKFDYTIANRLVTRNGKLTGGVRVNLEHGAKHTILTHIYKKFDVKPHEVISIGDSAGDIPLAQNSGYSIAFNCTSPELAAVVKHNCRTRDFNEVYKKILSITYE